MGLGPCPIAVSQEHVDSLDEQPQMYSGHRNNFTVKGVSFFGPDSEYVMSGSDCGHIFVWKKKDGRVIRIMEAMGV
ncbi:putative transcription factor WD40-like family [Helianthus annuus]|uniref:Transcription factor WD40-like family n=1 Tax=Helianthus annuus TaxID=4232 RepID=A0A9K3EHZ7_HELAN|nr:putative transcription factor WD40-like family [Helianthus annuus]KAJ0671126.1 putative transcription factor WD40-like family [Helianthus annuus]KAJ0849112.1 putative transcription factor WD40-like family [Helianthus annuus]KAJ0858123.1 putative transcription factor WD40-like family [Helianthus annuus]